MEEEAAVNEHHFGELVIVVEIMGKVIVALPGLCSHFLESCCGTSLCGDMIP